jgi:AcrR family transcriptional regulator
VLKVADRRPQAPRAAGAGFARRGAGRGAESLDTTARAGSGGAHGGSVVDGAAARRGDGGGTGRDVIGRGGVPDIQRARIVAALVEVSRERGAPRVTVAHIVARSGVSRRTFYEMFEDREACFLAAFDEAIERARARVLPAYRGAVGWQAQIRAGLTALLEFLDDEPGLGGVCVVDALGAGPEALGRRAQVVRALVDAVDGGRAEAKVGLRPTRLTAEGVVGGVLSVLYARLGEGDSGSMLKLLSALMGMIVMPYRGSAAAGREAARPAPRARRRSERPVSNPLEGLGMRLTYRTVLVLAAIGSRPGASNREVADASGVQDQGQISKLLVRLERLGLIANSASELVRGAPNAWQLTARGREVEHAIRAQTAPLAG